MGRFLLIIAAVVFSTTFALCAYTQEKGEIERKYECEYCGMDLEQFAHSRMVLEHDGGRSIGVCSINCAAVNFVKNLDDPPVSAKVGDFKTHRFIGCEKAYWVIGGSRPAVMAERAKWAFEKEQDAKSFIHDYGGRPASYEEVMRASYEDIYQDMRKLREMRLEYARARKKD